MKKKMNFHKIQYDIKQIILILLFGWLNGKLRENYLHYWNSFLYFQPIFFLWNQVNKGWFGSDWLNIYYTQFQKYFRQLLQSWERFKNLVDVVATAELKLSMDWLTSSVHGKYFSTVNPPKAEWTYNNALRLKNIYCVSISTNLFTRYLNLKIKYPKKIFPVFISFVYTIIISYLLKNQKKKLSSQ